MNQSDEIPFAKLITALCAMFAREADEPTIEGYWLGLSDLPMHAVRDAIGNSIRTCKFMPTVAELRQQSGELTPEGCAELAWACVRRAIDKHDYYESIDFDDPAINATLRSMGGWMKVCDRDCDQKEADTWMPQQFKKTYQAFARAGVTEEMGQPLLGFCEQQNAKGGHDEKHNPPMVRIETGLTPTRRIEAAAQLRIVEHVQ